MPNRDHMRLSDNLESQLSSMGCSLKYT
jgi:hypothetical protein